MNGGGWVAWICLLYALICCLGSHTLKWLVGLIFIGPNPISSRWTENSSFLSTGTSDSPVPTMLVDRWVRPLPRLSSIHRTVWCPDHVSRPLLDYPVHNEQFGATAQERPLWASLRRLFGVPPDSPVHTGHVVVHCLVHHQCAG
jgi:hypothetical protein